jgi:hypothetical protein
MLLTELRMRQNGFQKWIAGKFSTPLQSLAEVRSDKRGRL